MYLEHSLDVRHLKKHFLTPLLFCLYFLLVKTTLKSIVRWVIAGTPLGSLGNVWKQIWRAFVFTLCFSSVVINVFLDYKPEVPPLAGLTRWNVERGFFNSRVFLAVRLSLLAMTGLISSMASSTNWELQFISAADGPRQVGLVQDIWQRGKVMAQHGKKWGRNRSFRQFCIGNWPTIPNKPNIH